MQLQSAPALAASAESRIGYADPVIADVVTGWAIDILAPASPLLLQAVIDGEAAGEIHCALPRADVRAAGIPGEVGGFRYVIPARFMDGRSHCLRLELPQGGPVRFPAGQSGTNGEHVFALDPAEWTAGSAQLTELLAAHGITSQAFVPLFDVADYLALNGDAGLANAAQCVRHFARTGRAALCPVAIDWRFDPVFYAESVPEAAGLAPGAAYLHWLNEGIEAGLDPNPSALLRRLGLRDLRGMPAGFDPAIYCAANTGLPFGRNSRWRALRHVIEHGIPGRREGCPETAGNTDLYLAAADRLASGGRLAEAKAVYERVLAAEPANAHGLQHYADCLLRLGDHYAAEQAYLRVAAAGQASVWTGLNLAQCRAAAGRLHEAAAGLVELAARLPGDVAIAAKARGAAAAAFAAASARAQRLAACGFLEAGRTAMAQAAAALIEPVRARSPAVNRARRTVRSVAIVADCSLAQCRFYRVEQKLEQLAAAGIAARLHDAAQPLDAFASELAFTDAVIFYRVPALPPVVEAIGAARDAGLPTFYEIDDLIFDPAAFPDSFESYGGLVTAEEYAGLVTGTTLFAAAMSLCDYAIASTPALAAQMQPRVRSGRAFVHRNALGRAHLHHARLPARAAAGPVRIFYGTGTRAGNEDFSAHAAPALARLMDRHGDGVELVVMGHLSLPPCLGRHAPRIRRLDPVWDIGAYWSVLAQMDVSIAVLRDSLLSDCKSEIKWLEAAMFAIPSVVSGSATYREIVADGVDGLLAGSEQAWFDALERLVSGAQLRRAIGAAARDHALAAYSPESAATNLRAMMAAVTSRPRRRRKRVLIVNVFFPPQDIGGATRVVADNVSDLLREHGDALEIEVFTSTEGGQTPYARHRYAWRGAGVTAVTAGALDRPDWEAGDPHMAAIFGRVMDRFQPDLVHFHCIQRLTGALCRAARERGVPYLVTLHDGWWISDHQFLLDDGLRLRCYDHADPLAQLGLAGPESLRRMQVLHEHLANARMVLAVSEPFAALHRKAGVANVTVLENGVSDLALPARTPSPDGRVRLAYLGGVAPHKGYNLLKSALARSQFHRLALTVIDHALAPGMETQDVWGATPVRLRSKLPQAEVGTLYAATEVLVAPSVWPESFGLVAREARRAGCWVIASDRGAMGSEIHPGCGFVVGAGDDSGLARALAEINAHPARFVMPPALPASAPRSSREQASELMALYRQCWGEARPDDAAQAARAPRVKRAA